MNWNLLWIYILVLQLCSVTSHPVHDAENAHADQFHHDAKEDSNRQTDEKVISVRITSSVAVARGNGKIAQVDDDHRKESRSDIQNTTETSEINEQQPNIDLPPNLRGANIEFLKQLNAKKEQKHYASEHDFETSALRYDDRIIPEESNERHMGDAKSSTILSSEDFNSFRSKSVFILNEALRLADERINPNVTDEPTETKSTTENAYLSTYYEESEYNDEDKSTFDPPAYSKQGKEVDDSLAESSITSVLEIAKQTSDDYENIDNVPLARSLVHSPSSKNYIQGSNHKPPSERESSTRLTTVSFNIVHDVPKTPFSDPKPYMSPTHFQEHKLYESPTIYSQPSKIYSVPAKIYSEPAKIYSEPAKVYSEPAKVYSEPAKVYSVPAKFYSEPASLHLKPIAPTNHRASMQAPWQAPTTAHTTDTPRTPESATLAPQQENNHKIDEKVSVLTDGHSHGVQESTTEKCKQDNCKVGYVVKGRQFNKYRVEERTADGFIVGEYGVVRNEDGALRGVRYTADSEASPRLIYDALMKFLQLK